MADEPDEVGEATAGGCGDAAAAAAATAAEMPQVGLTRTSTILSLCSRLQVEQSIGHVCRRSTPLQRQRLTPT